MIGKEYFKFFEELEKNNNKEWFDENRKRYDKFVKKPFNDLVTEIITEVGFLDEAVSTLEPKNAIFRINRDIRFSNDKTPYKTQMSAIISPLGRKDKTYPGLYFEVDKSGVNVYGGIYSPDKDQLAKIRYKIASDLGNFTKLKNGDDFISHYGSFADTEKHVRIPKELAPAAEKEPLVFNKSFYFMSREDIDDMSEPRILDIVMIKYLAAKEMTDWLRDALLGD